MNITFKRLFAIGIALLVIMSCTNSTAFQPITEYAVRYTMDGDSIQPTTGNTIRLYGIDAPELNQSCHTDNKEWPCGRQSKQKLHTFVKNKRITCKLIEKDKYNRNVEDCSVDGKSIGEYMVENGWAVAYTRYSDNYTLAELRAKGNKLGVWGANCFIEPEKWRRGDRCR